MIQVMNWTISHVIQTKWWNIVRMLMNGF